MFLENAIHPENIKFLHASDIHLGSHQYSNLVRAQDYLLRFQQLLTLAQKHQVDCILLGGDVFTSIDILPGLFQGILQMLMKFQKVINKNIPIVAIEGNHDLRRYSHYHQYERGQSWLKVLSDLGFVYLLTGDTSSDDSMTFSYFFHGKKHLGPFTLKWLEVYGTQYTKQTPDAHIQSLSKSIPTKPSTFTVLLQHFGILGQMRNVPGVPYPIICQLRPQVDYLGLGHFHKGFTLENWVFNPGCPEYVSFSELSYPRGIFLANILRTEDRGSIVFKKSVKRLVLRNRPLVKLSVTLPRKFLDPSQFHTFLRKSIRKRLSSTSKASKNKKDQIPILYLKLTGISPDPRISLSRKNLSEALLSDIPFIDIRISKRFYRKLPYLHTIDNFLVKSASTAIGTLKE